MRRGTLTWPIRLALRDGLRCILRFKRIWLTFVLLGFGYSVFDFATSASLHAPVELDFSQITAPGSWEWPSFFDIWSAVPLRMLEGVAGIFDNATTTYPLSVVAAVLLLINWRGLHGALVRALAKRYRAWGYLIYLVVLISALATLCKPIIFWKLGTWMSGPGAASWLKRSAIVIPTAEIFEYLFGVYIQVYLITVCLAWIKGLSFAEGELFRFAMRRFSYVLEWAGLVVIVSTVIVRAPLLLAYFRNVPDVLDYLPLERLAMRGRIRKRGFDIEMRRMQGGSASPRTMLKSGVPRVRDANCCQRARLLRPTTARQGRSRSTLGAGR